MRPSNWIRLGLASGLACGVATAGAIAGGCGGDDNGALLTSGGPDGGGADHSVGPTVDAGGQDAVAPHSDSGSDSAPGDARADALPPPTNARVVLVHASPDLGPMRFCLATGQLPDGSDSQTVPVFPPLPNQLDGNPLHTVAGLYPGSGSALQDLGDFAGVAITVYAIDATKIAGDVADAGAGIDGGPDAATEQLTCVALIGPKLGTPGSLTAGKDYYPLGTFAKGTFPRSTTELITLTGCLGNATDRDAGAARCGANWDFTSGNIQSNLYALDTTSAPAANSFGAQVIHAASAVDGFESAEAGNAPVSQFIGLATGGGALPVGVPIAGPINFRGFAPDAAAVQEPGSALASTTSVDDTTFSGTGDGGPIHRFTLSLPTIALLSTGTGTALDGGPYFAPGESYTFVLMGDPTADPVQLPGALPDSGINPAYNGYGVHFLAFPNHPFAAKYP